MEWIDAKTIVNRCKDTSWFGTEYSMNIYKGCCHGCIYCDSRSACYHVEEFDRVRAKKDALKLIRNDLERKTRPGVVGTGAMSDPYNPFEKELFLTRHALELLSAYGFGAAVATKSDLIVRDADIFQEIKKEMPVLCKVTVTTADDALSKILEPHVCPSSKRLEAVASLSEKGIFTGILMMPILPLLEDSAENILKIVDLAAKAGAKFIYPAFGVTLRQNQREWYLSKLEECFPGRGLREAYERKYGERYYCPSPRSKELWTLFTQACGKKGLLFDMREIIRAYQLGYRQERQLSFFDS